MSGPTNVNLWKRYLDAEERGLEREAEAALAELFRGLPELAPRPGFAARVLVRLARPSLFARPLVRWSLAAALVAAAASSALLAPLLASLLGLVGPSGPVDALLAATSFVALRFVDGALAWEGPASLLTALGRAALTPQMLGFLFIQLAAAGLALRGLARLAAGKGSSHHALPH